MGYGVNCFLHRIDKNERYDISMGPACARGYVFLGITVWAKCPKCKTITVSISRAFPPAFCLECTAAGLPQISIVPRSHRTCPASTSENRTIRRPAWNSLVSHPAIPQRHMPGGAGGGGGCVRAQPRFKWWTVLTGVMMCKLQAVDIALFSLVVKEQTHFINTMIAKIFITNKNMGLVSLLLPHHYISFVWVN